jgi:hypothetical protein
VPFFIASKYTKPQHVGERMNNLITIQKRILELPRSVEPPSTTKPNAYVIGTHTAQDLRDLADSTDKLFYFDPSQETDPAIQAITNIEVLTKIEHKDCLILVVDAHINGKQFGSELTILKNLIRMIGKNNPFVFIRSEDPHQSALLVDFLNRTMNYDSYFWLRMNEAGESDSVWLMGLNKNLAVDFGMETAEETGHPRARVEEAPPLVQYNIVQ